MPGPILDARDSVINKSGKAAFHGAYILVVGTLDRVM